MKRILQIVMSVFMAMLIGTLIPVQVFADSPDYISEIKIFTGSYDGAAAEGYTILKDGNNPVDLNQNAGGGMGSKGEKAVYLGYKTTKNRDEAITDLALMNMKGGYRTSDYESLMERQMNGQIIPFVDNFLAAIKEYRANYNSKYTLNKKRAMFVYDALNKLTDDDCGGAGLGDLLLNETVYEKAKKAFDALSAKEKEKTNLIKMNDQVRDSLPEAERNQCADILTILAQSNGNATLIMENLITRAADQNEDLWLDRFTEITYDKLVEETGESPTDADKILARLYDDKANEIVDMWDDFREHLENYDNAVAILESASKKDLSEEAEAIDGFDFETSTKAEAEEAAEASVVIQYSAEELANASADVFCKEFLETIDYEDGSLLELFMTPAEEIDGDTEILYPLVASLTKGQQAGLEFVTLQDLVMFGSTDEDGYQAARLDTIDTTSIYFGVDRAIYEKGGVALTSDAIRNDVTMEQTPEQSVALHIWAGIAAGLSLIGTSAFVSSWIVKNSTDKIISTYNSTFKNLTDSIARNNAAVSRMKVVLERYNQKGLTELAKTQTENIKSYTQAISNAEKNLQKMGYDAEFIKRMEVRSNFCGKLRMGAAVFTVVMVAITAILVYYDYQQMKEYYNVDFTPMPQYIIEEKDLIGYNNKGEAVVLKNQSAYYKLVECNRTANDEFFGVLGTGADMNGDVGQQWLALYAVRNKIMDPIIADSLLVKIFEKTDDFQIPAGYTTGVHMFGTEAAFNLNSSLYDWNNSAPCVYIFFNTDENASTTGSSFTAGSMALTGVAGLAIGALISGIAISSANKKKSKKAVA